MELIQSVHNPKVKAWYQLQNKKGREQSKSFMIEGFKLVEEALSSKQEIEYIISEEDKDLPKSINDYMEKLDIPMVQVSKPVIEKLSETQAPQGILAIIKQQSLNLEQVISSKFDFFLLIDQIQDPGNLGTIIRSADAAGVDAIILGYGTVDIYNQKVIRSAMGSIFHLPILNADLDSSIRSLKEHGVKVIGTSPYADRNYFDVNLKDKIAIIVGNESKGLSEERMEQVDEMVNIPLIGQAESLNVAMATTLVLYERVRTTTF